MFDTLFIDILNMSYIASFVIIFVLITRFLMKKVPKIFVYALWIPVLFKLICPFSFESIWGLLPTETTPISYEIVYEATPEIYTGFTSIDNTVNSVLPTSPEIGNSINPIQVWLFIGQTIWLIGIAVLLIYSIISLIKLNLKLKISMNLRDNIYIADYITSPFVIGFIKPKIYLPPNLSEHEREYIIAHEQIHIKRFDHITRLVSFVVLAVHWFNPFVWLAFILSNKDMEMSCDEAVMNKLDKDIKSDYSNSLLRFAVSKNVIHPTPLAFGESDTKARIKNIMKYKKVNKITAVVLGLAIAVFGIFLVSENISNQAVNEIATDNEYDNLEVFSMSNVQEGEKISTSLTNQEEILALLSYFESGTITSDSNTQDSTNPYYYRFCKDDEVVLEYIFQDNDFSLMYTEDGLKNVEYSGDLSLSDSLIAQLEKFENDVIEKEELLQNELDELEIELIEEERKTTEDYSELEFMQSELVINEQEERLAMVEAQSEAFDYLKDFLDIMFAGNNSKIDKIFDPENSESYANNCELFLSSYLNDGLIEDYQSLSLEIACTHFEMYQNSFTIDLGTLTLSSTDDESIFNYTTDVVLENSEITETQEIVGTFQLDENGKISYFRDRKSVV